MKGIMYSTRNASGKLQFPALHIPLFAALDAEDDGTEGEEEEDENGSSGTDADDDEDASGEDDGVRNPESKRASEEAKRYRLRLREVEARLAEAEREKKERERAEMTELDQARDRVKELEEETAKKDAVLATLQLKSALSDSGVQSRFVSSKVMMEVFVKDWDLEPNADGTYDEKDVKAAADKFLKANPWAEASGSGTNNSGNLEGGSPTNGRRKTNEPDTSVLKKKFPALNR